MSEALRFELLGPQRAWYADRQLDLGPAKQRAVLAVLLLAAGRPVPSGQIVEAVWPDEAPVNGLNVVQKHVAGLRRLLEPDRSPRTPARVLTLTDAGYLLRVPPEAVDVARFERGVRRARAAQAAGRTEEALAEVSAALELWQGEPFTGFAGAYFDTARHRLVELRAVALETRTELELADGRHGELVGRLVELVAEFPVRERLRHQLMLALHRSGRQAEALAAYRDYAGLLRDEYGIEPGGALQDLHRRILRADPDLLAHAPRRPAQPTGPAEPTAPAQPTGPAEPTAPPQPTVSAQLTVPVQFTVSAQPGGPFPPPPPGESPAGLPPWVSPPVAPLIGAVPPSRRPSGVPGWLSVVATVGGALVALFSFGMLTWLVVLLYGVWRRGWGSVLAAVYYLTVAVTFVVVIGSSETEEVSAPEATLMVIWLTTWAAGVPHVVLLNGRLLAWLRGLWRGRPYADRNRLRREYARYLLYQYPSARDDLRIGRPDLPRAYDDGGLVDVNSVPDHVIAGLPGLTRSQAQHVVVDRRMRGPYTSMEELASRCLLPAAATDSLRELLVFLPPAPASGPPTSPPGPPVTSAAPGRNAG
ncbi:BTAD domain-containing putative transcriptional regulator [Micromonospora sp. C28ISP2-4]|uniref:BTAD domain-containing putative transcriptional regulator n=1 Tax=Micromonospora sp. C28ISP2-4 TaxID=3059523 RepID=UPI0026758E76|nr:BTAD domain-containing putative transcriptional regulator [Micromonospora sp. C28ISP2-4]MDO3684603.1 BTAD domain-containing putative transcriptional regulator [Micromonospora sp. C28ISP2-4]